MYSPLGARRDILGELARSRRYVVEKLSEKSDIDWLGVGLSSFRVVGVAGPDHLTLENSGNFP